MPGKTLGKEKNLLLAVVGACFLWKGFTVGIGTLLGWVFLLPGAAMIGMLGAAYLGKKEGNGP